MRVRFPLLAASLAPPGLVLALTVALAACGHGYVYQPRPERGTEAWKAWQTEQEPLARALAEGDDTVGGRPGGDTPDGAFTRLRALTGALRDERFNGASQALLAEAQRRQIEHVTGLALRADRDAIEAVTDLAALLTFITDGAQRAHLLEPLHARVTALVDERLAAAATGRRWLEVASGLVGITLPDGIDSEPARVGVADRLLAFAESEVRAGRPLGAVVACRILERSTAAAARRARCGELREAARSHHEAAAKAARGPTLPRLHRALVALLEGRLEPVPPSVAFKVATGTPDPQCAGLRGILRDILDFPIGEVSVQLTLDRCSFSVLEPLRTETVRLCDVESQSRTDDGWVEITPSREVAKGERVFAPLAVGAWAGCASSRSVTVNAGNNAWANLEGTAHITAAGLAVDIPFGHSGGGVVTDRDRTTYHALCAGALYQSGLGEHSRDAWASGLALIADALLAAKRPEEADDLMLRLVLGSRREPWPDAVATWVDARFGAGVSFLLQGGDRPFSPALVFPTRAVPLIFP